VLDLGITIASNMLLSLDAVGFLRNPTGNIVGAAAALLVIVAYAGIAAQLCLALVETYVVLTGGCLFLGFAAFRGTAGLAEGYILYAFQTGARIYLLYLLLGVGTALSREWAGLTFATGGPAGTPPSLALHFQVLAGALVFCLLVWKVPSGVAARLTQGASLRLGEALA
jgi:type IV secretion system protein TrbL